MIEHLNIINALSDQIKSILDLMMMCEDIVDIKSIKTASEMCMTMHDELMVEVGKIEEEYKENKIVEKLPGDYMDEMANQNSEIIKALSPKGYPDMPKEIICNCTKEAENKSDIEEIKKVIKENFKDASHGIFFTRNIAGDHLSTIYKDGKHTVEICTHYEYFEVFGLTPEEQNKVAEFYYSLKRSKNK